MGGNDIHSEAEGNGPVDATLHAIENKMQSGAELLLYSVNAITSGTESQGEVTVRLSKGGTDCEWSRHGSRHYCCLGQGLFSGIE